jgi:MFS superfamily sulfate permease-like transporter
MGEMVFLAFLSAVGLIIVMSKIGLKHFLKLGWITDLIASVFLGMIFFGTFSGMAVGIMAGIFISIFLLFIKVVSRVKNFK